jgi:uncharacterized BrkB/YihY/UPF0761 family membrane protein
MIVRIPGEEMLPKPITEPFLDALANFLTVTNSQLVNFSLPFMAWSLSLLVPKT